MHQLGKAIDIQFAGAIPNPDWSKWRIVADSAKKFGIDWMYDLNKLEKSHFQDDGTPLNPFLMQIPDWAKETVAEMKAAGIETDPQTEVGSMKLYHLMAVIDKFQKRKAA